MRMLLLIGFMLPLGLDAPSAPDAGLDIRPRLELTVNEDDRMVEVGDSLVFEALVENPSKKTLRGTLTWSLLTVADLPAPPKEVTFRIKGEQFEVFAFELPFKKPGFAMVGCRVVVDGTGQKIERSIRVGAAAEKVEVELTRKRDFKKFWKKTLKDLGKVDPEFTVVPRKNKTDAPCDLFEVSMKSLGGVLVRGWLEVPKRPGPHPALLRLPGYTSNMLPLGTVGDSIIFSFNIRAHGNSTDDVPSEPVDYWLRGLDDKEGYFYQGAFMDCIRAMDFLASRQDVAQHHIGVWGGSQGGGMSFITAALDRRVAYCVADVPWLGNWENYLILNEKGPNELEVWVQEKKGRSVQDALKTLSYFDTVNFADRIYCPTYMGVGLQDKICPPIISFATFNRVRGPKKFRIWPKAGHALGGEHVEWVIAELRALAR